jgi:hypothetical protein
MKKVIAFTIADANNLKYYEMLKNSLRKFHSEEELPLKLISANDLESRIKKDPAFFYRATPIVAKTLLDEYEYVIKLDADQIITGKLDELWSGDFDAAVVNNFNPREYKNYPYTILNIHPFAYVNCGLVVMKSKSFVEWWEKSCFSTLFGGLQMREQDMLNIMVHSNNYNIKKLDEGDSFWGLASKGYWPNIIMREKDLVLPKDSEWPDKDKVIRVLHWAGGNEPNKMHYQTKFQPEVVKRLDFLTK